jgi:hypothetical protein
LLIPNLTEARGHFCPNFCAPLADSIALSHLMVGAPIKVKRPDQYCDGTVVSGEKA